MSAITVPLILFLTFGFMIMTNFVYNDFKEIQDRDISNLNSVCKALSLYFRDHRHLPDNLGKLRETTAKRPYADYPNRPYVNGTLFRYSSYFDYQQLSDHQVIISNIKSDRNKGSSLWHQEFSIRCNVVTVSITANS